MGCTVCTPCGGFLSPSHGIIQVWVAGVCPSCRVRKLGILLSIQCCSRTHRGMGGMQVINLHPYKHTTATLLVHSHWVMSPMKQRSVCGMGWEATPHTVLSIQSRSGLAVVWGWHYCDTCVTVYDVSGLVTLLRIEMRGTSDTWPLVAQQSCQRMGLIQRRP